MVIDYHFMEAPFTGSGGEWKYHIYKIRYDISLVGKDHFVKSVFILFRNDVLDPNSQTLQNFEITIDKSNNNGATG